MKKKNERKKKTMVDYDTKQQSRFGSIVENRRRRRQGARNDLCSDFLRSAQLAETYFRFDTGQTLFGLNRRCDPMFYRLECKATTIVSFYPPGIGGSSIRHLVHDARNDR